MGRNSLDQLSLFNLEDYEKKYDSSIETYTCRKCKKAKPITRDDVTLHWEEKNTDKRNKLLNIINERF